jgi:hypothetical protein
MPGHAMPLKPSVLELPQLADWRQSRPGSGLVAAKRFHPKAGLRECLLSGPYWGPKQTLRSRRVPL